MGSLERLLQVPADRGGALEASLAGLDLHGVGHCTACRFGRTRDSGMSLLSHQRLTAKTRWHVCIILGRSQSRWREPMGNGKEYVDYESNDVDR